MDPRLRGRARNVLFAVWAVVCLLALVWPGYDLIGNRLEPFVLGVPFVSFGRGKDRVAIGLPIRGRFGVPRVMVLTVRDLAVLGADAVLDQRMVQRRVPLPQHEERDEQEPEETSPTVRRSRDVECADHLASTLGDDRPSCQVKET